jgi:hypothetical protein
VRLEQFRVIDRRGGNVFGRRQQIIGTAMATALIASMLDVGLGAASAGANRAPAARAATASPARELTGHRLRPRAGAVRPGTRVRSSQVFGDRVFADAKIGFALAGVREAQYPARSTDGGRIWRIDGPQVHVDAADAPEAVSRVGVGGTRTFFAYGSSAVDVTTDGGRTWWETFLGELVMSVVPGPGNELIAYVQQSVNNGTNSPATTWQYVSRDGGRHWRYSTSLGGF